MLIESSSNGLRSVSLTVDRKDLDRLRNSLICFPREARKRETFSCCLAVGFWGRSVLYTPPHVPPESDGLIGIQRT